MKTVFLYTPIQAGEEEPILYTATRKALQPVSNLLDVSTSAVMQLKGIDPGHQITTLKAMLLGADVAILVLPWKDMLLYPSLPAIIAGIAHSHSIPVLLVSDTQLLDKSTTTKDLVLFCNQWLYSPSLDNYTSSLLQMMQDSVVGFMEPTDIQA